jgi:hypothetical protein
MEFFIIPIMIGGQVILPLIIVLLLRALQKKFPKTRTLYVSSKIAFIFIFVMFIVTLFFNFFFRSERLLDLIDKVFLIGSLLTEKILKPYMGSDIMISLHVALSAMFSEILYTIILFPIVSIVFYIKKKRLINRGL